MMGHTQSFILIEEAKHYPQIKQRMKLIFLEKLMQGLDIGTSTLAKTSLKIEKNLMDLSA